MDQDDLLEFLSGAASREKRSDEEEVILQNRAFDGDISLTIERLKSAATSYNNAHEFKAGDVVRWKDGLRNRSFTYGQPLVVLEVFPEPWYDREAGGGSALFGEPLDIRIAVYLTDGELVPFVIDSKRLELHDGELKDHDKNNLKKYDELKSRKAGKKPALSEAEIIHLVGKPGEA